MNEEDAIISIEDLWYKYPTSEDWVLQGLSLSIRPSEFVCITGPSGCGKSTLLYCLNGIIPHAMGGIMRGKLIVDTFDTRNHSLYELAKNVALVQQNPENQIRTLTVQDEVAFGPENLLLPKEEVVERGAWSLEMVKAKHLADRETSQLSGGQKQRIAIASALSMKPRILVLDEPTSNIDPGGTVEILQNLKDIHQNTDITIVVVEHKLDLFLSLADRLVVIKQGKAIYDGEPRSIMLEGHTVFSDIGIRLPQVFELFTRLRNIECSWPDALPLTIEEGLEAMKGWLGEGFSCVCSPASGKTSGQGEVVAQASGLKFHYPNGYRALNGVDLAVRRGEFVGIIGNNGSGKTTFLLHLMGILKPESGSVTVFGMDTKNTPVSTIARKVGMVFQYPSHQLFEDSVIEEVLFAPRNFGMDGEVILERSEEVLKTADLQGSDERYPQTLSTGQMKRLNLASILVYDPELIILDEPFLGQDYGHAKKTMDVLGDLNRDCGRTIVIVSHAINELAEYAERLVLFEGGKIVEDGPTRQVMGRMSEREGTLFFCTPICRLARLLTGHSAQNLPSTVGDMISVLRRA